MKIYALPEHLQAPPVDYIDYSQKTIEANEEKHKALLKDDLLQSGYGGEHTGKILAMPYADGAALYMFAHADAKGAPSCLIHLPYGDAWECPNAGFLPKKEVIARIEAQEKRALMFG